MLLTRVASLLFGTPNTLLSSQIVNHVSSRLPSGRKYFWLLRGILWVTHSQQQKDPTFKPLLPYGSDYNFPGHSCRRWSSRGGNPSSCDSTRSGIAANYELGVACDRGIGGIKSLVPDGFRRWTRQESTSA